MNRNQQSVVYQAAGKGQRLGEANPNSALTESDVREIRRLRGRGVKFREIADAYRVHESAIYLIVRRKRWAHVA